jgi:large subunit ribosomal protein L23
MALFGKKTEKKAEKKPAKVTKAIVPATTVGSSIGNYSGNVIVRPHVTEKAGIQSESSNVYTFQVYKSANKGTVTRAIKSLYKVSPVKVRIVNLPERKVFVKGKFGSQPGIKKAMVYLKKGDKIEFI